MKKRFVMAGLIAAMLAGLAGPSDAGTRNFFNPTVGGDRLSFCANYDGICGKAIADASSGEPGTLMLARPQPERRELLRGRASHE